MINGTHHRKFLSFFVLFYYYNDSKVVAQLKKIKKSSARSTEFCTDKFTPLSHNSSLGPTTTTQKQRGL